MWNDLVSTLEAWRNSVPWQIPTMFCICVVSLGAITMDNWLKARRAKRIAKLLDASYPARYRQIVRQSYGHE